MCVVRKEGEMRRPVLASWHCMRREFVTCESGPMGSLLAHRGGWMCGDLQQLGSETPA